MAILQGLSWPWSHGIWIYNYLCNQCLSPLMLWVTIWIRARCITLCDKVCQCQVSSTNKTDCHNITDRHNKTGRHNKTDRHNITEILLKVALNTNVMILGNGLWCDIGKNILIRKKFHKAVILFTPLQGPLSLTDWTLQNILFSLLSNWNIVESGIKHHNTNLSNSQMEMDLFLLK